MRKKKLLPRKKIMDRGEIEKEKEFMTYYECKKLGYFRVECPLLKKEFRKKRKAFMTTWSDSGESSSED